MADAKPLTTANWTPDVVASILGTLFGINTAILLIFLELTMPTWPVRIFDLLIMLLIAYSFNRIAFHMELDGRRHFQQAFSMLIPVTTLLFTATLLADAVKTIFFNNVQRVAYSLNPLNALSGAPAPEMGTVSLQYQEPLILTSIVAFIILLPFLIHSLKERTFSASWILFLLVPLLLWSLVTFVAYAAMQIASAI